ncbi:MAG: hypothetical protein AAGA23_01610 [Pseudomonadota bacterium]
MNPFSLQQPLPLRPILLAPLLLALLAGCASDQRSRELDSTLNLYRKTLRWDAARTAAQFLDPESRPTDRQLEFQINRLEQFKVSGYQVSGPGTFTADGQFSQAVQLYLSNRHTAVEKVVMDRQLWRWDETRERWWLTTGLPDLDQAR